MREFLYFLDKHATDLLFAIALVAMVYALARMLNARQSISIAFAFTPLLMVWAWSNASARHFVLAQFL